jgi:hypothetical protein
LSEEDGDLLDCLEINGCGEFNEGSNDGLEESLMNLAG